MSTNMNDDWRMKSACHKVTEVDPLFQTAWIVKGDVGSETAVSICEGCPVRALCLIDALSDPEASGLRAGYFFDYGVVSKKDARAILNEVGIVACTSQRENRKRLRSLRAEA